MSKFKTAKEAMRYMAQFYDNQCFVTQEKLRTEDLSYIIYGIFIMILDERISQMERKADYNT